MLRCALHDRRLIYNLLMSISKCAIIRKFVLNLLRAQPEAKSLNRKRNLCALSDEYREKCLGF